MTKKFINLIKRIQQLSHSYNLSEQHISLLEYNKSFLFIFKRCSFTLFTLLFVSQAVCVSVLIHSTDIDPIYYDWISIKPVQILQLSLFLVCCLRNMFSSHYEVIIIKPEAK